MSDLDQAILTLERWKNRLKGKSRISVKADEVEQVIALIMEFAMELSAVQEEKNEWPSPHRS